jgi:hypothetical protein
MKTCNEYQEMMASYLDHSCSPKEQELLLAHFATCDSCSTQAYEMTTLLSHLSSLEEIEPPADLHQKIMSAVTAAPKKKLTIFTKQMISFGAVAAAIAILFGGGRYWINLLNTSQPITAPLNAPQATAPMAQSAGVPSPPLSTNDTPASASIAQDSSIKKGVVSESQSVAPLPGPRMADAESSQNDQGFYVRLYTGGKMSKAEVANLLNVSWPEDKTILTISKELLPLLSELSQQYGFTLDVEIFKDAIPYGIVEMLD